MRKTALGNLGKGFMYGSSLVLLSGAMCFAQDYRKQTYMPVVPRHPFTTMMEQDQGNRPEVMQKQQALLEARYDLQDQPASQVLMSNGKAVQGGVRMKIPSGLTWEQLAHMGPGTIRSQDLFPKGFYPLPHAKHETGGQVFFSYPD